MRWENNDKELTIAREWLHRIDNKIEYINSFASQEEFLKCKKCGGSSFPNKELVQEYVNGLNFINKIVSVRQIAAEAIISGKLEEETYWLIRHGDFALDYCKLKGFILAQYKIQNCSSSYDRKAFRIVVKRWRESVIQGIENAYKGKWSQYDEDLECN